MTVLQPHLSGKDKAPREGSFTPAHSSGECSPTATIVAHESDVVEKTSKEVKVAQDDRSREPVYIEWSPADPEYPFNWSKFAKFSRTILCFGMTMMTAVNATAYSSALTGATRDLHCSTLAYTAGTTTYLGSVAFGPLLLAPLSEVYGRRLIYIVAAFSYAVLYIPQAVAPNVATLIATRFFQGLAASVGNSLVGGSVSDVFMAHERGVPMSLFSLLVYVGQAIGPVAGGYTSANPSLGWRWISWWQCIISFGSWLLMLLFLKETRSNVLLSRRAKRLTKETGVLHLAADDEGRKDMVTLMKISLSRPIVFLFTEPVVIAFSLWIGFTWGVLFLLYASVPLAFEQYGWSEGQQGLVFVTVVVGALLGWLANLHQGQLYKRAERKAGGTPDPENRLHWSCVGGLVFPAGLFILAWGGRPEVHPAVPIVGLVVINAGIYPIYLAVFLYLSLYEQYTSSALAAQSFLRNILGATFPLFARGMYTKLSPPVASSILGGIGFALAIVPFALMSQWGRRIRASSPVAKQMEREAKEEEEKRDRRHAREA